MRLDTTSPIDNITCKIKLAMLVANTQTYITTIGSNIFSLHNDKVAKPANKVVICSGEIRRVTYNLFVLKYIASHIWTFTYQIIIGSCIFFIAMFFTN